MPPDTTPKFVKDRLIRIETRLVKYQESNVVQMDELAKTIDSLSSVLQLLLQKLEALTDDGTKKRNG